MSALELQPQPHAAHGTGHRVQETGHMASSIIPSVGIDEEYQDSEENIGGSKVCG